MLVGIQPAGLSTEVLGAGITFTIIRSASNFLASEIARFNARVAFFEPSVGSNILDGIEYVSLEFVLRLKVVPRYVSCSAPT